MEIFSRRSPLLSLVLGGWLAIAGGTLFGQGGAQPSPKSGNAAATVTKQLGSIRAITGSRLVLATDKGDEVPVQVQSGARLLRLAPGQTDLKNATAIQLPDLQIGDRALVRGTLEADGKTLDAAALIIMTQQDIGLRRREEMLDWQRRGVGGLVQQVDAQAGTVMLSVAGAPGEAQGGTVLVHVNPKTSYRRYSPDSVKWQEAIASRFGEIRVGDQLRARGSRSEDGRQLEAEEMVFGSFRNIAGLISSTDSANSTLTVQDLATNKPVTVQITRDSKIKKLPPQMAQGLAMRSRGEAPSAPAQDDHGPASGGRARTGDLRPNLPEEGRSGTPLRPNLPEEGRSGTPLNQRLARLPDVTLAELQKGDAVMIVSTAGSEGKLPRAIVVLGGAEPILRANPNGRSTDWLLTPWSLASAPGGEQP